MSNYSKSSIYKLCCKNFNITDIYIGSTTNFSRRKNHHKHCCNTPSVSQHNLKVYTFIRDNGGFENWDMIQIEQCSCVDKRELHTYERHWIEQLKPTLNCQLPLRNKQEYRESIKDLTKIYMKDYYIKNKDAFAIKTQIYRENNKEKISEKDKKYNLKNWDKINSKFMCECGEEINKRGYNRHITRSLHLKNIENIMNILNL
jgi:hypothetical protein